VYRAYFADPFVWKADGTYYAVGTGAVEASGDTLGRDICTLFPMLRSGNLVDWEPIGAALVRPENSPGDHFWAPEVARGDDGRYYLYYSVGWGDKGHQIFVAASDESGGPYRQVAGPLVDPAQCPFAIDPNPFRDADGRWYLFYARDYLDTAGGSRAGTALAVRPMDGMTKLGGEERTVLRARHDWTLFKAGREMYGRVWDWHTLEGPCVVRRGGRYYCLYSGSNWETLNYGVDWCVADGPLGPWGGESREGPRLLRSVPGKVRGPGHNSVVTGPDGNTDCVVYHAWDEWMTARRLCIDRLEWTPQGPRCDGPTWTPRPAP
jgi:GH43 family beta-xylosidase